MVHNLRLEPDIDIDAIKYLQHSLRDGMITPEDGEDAWADDCSSNEESDNDYCSDDDTVVGAFYQVFSTRWPGRA
jgi:hypothetical protein